MTKRALAAGLLLLLLVMVAACSKSNDGNGVASVRSSAAPTPTPSLSLQEQAIRYVRCMRAHRVPMGDPEVDERGIRFGAVDKAAVGNDALRSAEAACKQDLPVLPPEMRALKTEKSREFSRCMRARGLADFPDPEPDGQVTVPESIMQDPRYDQAKTESTEHVRSYSPHP